MTERKKTLSRRWLDIPIPLRMAFYLGLGFLLTQLAGFCQTFGTVVG